MRDGSVNALINKLIEGFCGHANPSVFLLEAALDEDRYRDLLGQGIGEIDLGISGYQQTLEYVTGQGQIPQAGLFSVLSSLVNGAPTQERREAAEKIKGRFILRPGHDWDDVEVKDLLADMALGLLDGDGGDEGFAIVTKTGLRITQSYVRLRDDFNVEGNSRVVDTTQVFDGLRDALIQFREMGMIE